MKNLLLCNIIQRDWVFDARWLPDTLSFSSCPCECTQLIHPDNEQKEVNSKACRWVSDDEDIRLQGEMSELHRKEKVFGLSHSNRAAVAQWSNNWKVGGSIHTLATQRSVKLTAGGVSVHLLATAEVPLSKAPYPHGPRRCDWLPTTPVYGICLYECDPVHVHVCVQYNLKAREEENTGSLIEKQEWRRGWQHTVEEKHKGCLRTEHVKSKALGCWADELNWM